MTLNPDQATAVFCDWLDVTAPPGEGHRLITAIGPLLCSAGALKLTDDLYEMNGGKVKIGPFKQVYRVSISGACIRLLEVQGLWSTLLSHIADGPHRVTRLDAAIDFPMDGADALEALQGAYPRGEVRLSQRPIKITEMLCTRPDGRKTGTWYAGHRSGAEITCRVYDKAQQLLDTRGETIPSRTRAELTIRKGGTLRDAMEPERVFWHYMAPAVIKRPPGVPEWSSGWAEGWTMTRVELLPYQALKRRIETSSEIAALIELADTVGSEGRTAALRMLEARFREASPLGSRQSLAKAS